jgi:peptidoglycan/LPS O-acetylase OafA/YrhL
VTHPSRAYIPFLSAVRGVLALCVVLYHVSVAFKLTMFNVVGINAVRIFFALSGYVLARGYDGRVLVFMARRVVRLWPLFALCLSAGYAGLGVKLPWTQLVWWPMPPHNVGDPPAWSLYWEAWATPFFPIAFAIAARNRSVILVLALMSHALVLLEPGLDCVFWFGLGVAGSRFRIAWPTYAPGWTTWLGTVSYPLYLCHAVIMQFFLDLGGAWAVAACVPVCFAVAAVLERTVDRPAVWLSRQIGKVRVDQVSTTRA